MEDFEVYIDDSCVLTEGRVDVLVWKAFKYRLYPRGSQIDYFNRLFGCCRWVYNHFLEIRIAAWKAKQADSSVCIPSRFDMCKSLTQLKRETVGNDGVQFLREVDSTALVYEISHLDAAFDGFFRRAAKRKASGSGAKAGFPRFKGRNSKRRATVAFPNRDYIGADHIRFAKVGWVRANVHRPIEGEPVCATVSQDSADRWWVSIKCRDVPVTALPGAGAAIGLSLGDEPLVVTSEGARFGCGAMSPEEKRRLARERRKLARRDGPSRRSSPSARYEKQRLKVAKLYAKEADKRASDLDNLTARLVEQYDAIVVRDTGKHEFLSRLRYKCEWRGRAYVELPPLQGASPVEIDDRIEQARRDLQEGLALLERVARGSGDATAAR